MKLTTSELCDLMITIANSYFNGRFLRRPLMDATEIEVRQLGLWELDDDKLSESAGVKSRGLAKIDWAFSSLVNEKRVINIRRGEWCLPNVEV